MARRRREVRRDGTKIARGGSTRDLECNEIARRDATSDRDARRWPVAGEDGILMDRDGSATPSGAAG